MMTAIKRLLWLNKVQPVTHHDVEPAPRDPEKERQIKQAQTELVKVLMAGERSSWAIRQELAGNVLDIVSGESR